MVTSINDHQVMYISAGGEFNVAMDTDYTLWVWGKNEFGQVPDLYLLFYPSLVRQVI